MAAILLQKDRFATRMEAPLFRNGTDDTRVLHRASRSICRDHGDRLTVIIDGMAQGRPGKAWQGRAPAAERRPNRRRRLRSPLDASSRSQGRGRARAAPVSRYGSGGSIRKRQRGSSCPAMASRTGVRNRTRAIPRFMTGLGAFTALLTGVALSMTGSARAQTRQFDVPRQRAASGISAFSRLAPSVQLLVAQDAVRGRWTNRVHGNYRVETALTLLLRRSGLHWLRTGPTAYSLVVTSKDHRR